jgi:hypothetical protein
LEPEARPCFSPGTLNHPRNDAARDPQGDCSIKADPERLREA